MSIATASLVQEPVGGPTDSAPRLRSACVCGLSQGTAIRLVISFQAQASQHRPMTRLLLHIGHPKTGTTALQTVFAANAARLRATASVCYPISTIPAEHKHALAIPWLLGLDNSAIRRRARCQGEALLTLSKTYWHSLLAESREWRSECIILSAEGFWPLHQAAPERIRFFRDCLYAIASHVSVIGYLRSPAPFFASRMNQKLRNYRQVVLPGVSHYRAAIEAWEAVGFDQSHWHIFDRDLLLNRDIVDDFCSRHLSGCVDVASLRRGDGEKGNASVSNEALVILQDVAATYPILRDDARDPRRQRIVEMLRCADAEIGGFRQPSLTEAARVAIVQRCEDLGWLQQRGLCFPDIDPSLITSQRPEPGLDRFSQVQDCCPIDPERLARLRAATGARIDALFSCAPRRVLRALQRRASG